MQAALGWRQFTSSRVEYQHVLIDESEQPFGTVEEAAVALAGALDAKGWASFRFGHQRNERGSWCDCHRCWEMGAYYSMLLGVSFIRNPHIFDGVRKWGGGVSQLPCFRVLVCWLLSSL